MDLNKTAQDLLAPTLERIAADDVEVTSVSIGERDGRVALVLEWRPHKWADDEPTTPMRPPIPAPVAAAAPNTWRCPACGDRDLLVTNDGTICGACGSSFGTREDGS